MNNVICAAMLEQGFVELFFALCSRILWGTILHYECSCRSQLSRHFGGISNDRSQLSLKLHAFREHSPLLVNLNPSFALYVSWSRPKFAIQPSGTLLKFAKFPILSCSLGLVMGRWRNHECQIFSRDDESSSDSAWSDALLVSRIRSVFESLKTQACLLVCVCWYVRVCFGVRKSSTESIFAHFFVQNPLLKEEEKKRETIEMSVVSKCIPHQTEKRWRILKMSEPALSPHSANSVFTADSRFHPLVEVSVPQTGRALQHVLLCIWVKFILTRVYRWGFWKARFFILCFFCLIREVLIPWIEGTERLLFAAVGRRVTIEKLRIAGEQLEVGFCKFSEDVFRCVCSVSVLLWK